MKDIENHRLISKFMKNHIVIDNVLYDIDKDLGNQFKFDTWSKLMPVVERIINSLTTVEILFNGIKIEMIDFETLDSTLFGCYPKYCNFNSKLETLFSAILRYVEWINAKREK